MLVDQSAQRLQPGTAIIVGQSDARGHLLLGLGRMKIVGVVKFTSEPLRQQPSDGRLTRPFDTHNDYDLDRTAGYAAVLGHHPGLRRHSGRLLKRDFHGLLLRSCLSQRERGFRKEPSIYAGC